MADLSQYTPDEEYTDLDERLRAEEPPFQQDDTNPSRAMQAEAMLRSEEPPISDEDTSPSLVSRAMLSDNWPPDRRGGRGASSRPWAARAA